MQHGFKTRAKALALELRAELGLTAHDPFDPHQLATEYGVPILRLSELDISEQARQHCAIDNPKAFSGALINHGKGVVIVENDAHSPQRRRSTLSHELAHVILEHPYELALTYDRKCGTGANNEDDADWLAAELLIPAEATLRLAWRDVIDEAVAARFGVSLVYARWRMNKSGSRKIVTNTRRRRAG